MPYYINKTNGEALVTLEDGTLDTTTVDLALVGKNYPTYGLSLNQNFVKLLENFASVDEPATPLRGQIWYNSNSRGLHFYREGSTADNWHKVASIEESATNPVDPRQGDLWFDTDAEQLRIYSGTEWITVGPQTTSTGLLRVAGTNDFRVQIGATEVFRIDSSGRRTLPFNPTVQATGRQGSTNLTTANTSTFVIWVPSTVTTNIGDYFSAGVFTAPITGRYRVHVNLTTNGSGQHVARWRVNDSDYGISATNSHTSGIGCLVASGIIEASEGDLITLACATDSGAAISYQNNSYTIELVS
jgi:hypothetical protein